MYNVVDTDIKSNINKSQRKAIKDLQKDTSIVIKEADKGGAIVIMDANHYEQMVSDQLEDQSFSKKLPQNEDKKTMSQIGKLIRNHGQNLTKNEIDYLTNFEVRTSNFYGLPKIHKSKEIQENIRNCKNTHIKIPKPEDLKLRPIIAGPSSSTQRLSNLLDILLKPLCKKVPSFIRDDMDFLNYIPDRVPLNTILVSFDVTSLYTNIPHDLGIQAVTFWLEKYQAEIPTRFPPDFIVSGLKLVLENNHFYFNDNFYLQIKGTAMGTKVAPTYATLVMGYLEEKLYNELPFLFDVNFATYIKENWKRCLDDCFIFWTKSEEELQTFHSTINSIHQSIKFTIESSTTHLPFLGILIIKEEEKIKTDLYCKPTDTHQYLSFNSCHPSHTKRNIPFNLARRICTIVSENDTKKKRLYELKIFLKRQHYPEGLIDSAIRKALDIPINELRNTRDKDENNGENIPFVITHNLRNHNILSSAKRFFPILEQSPNMKNLVKESNIINSRRQAPNLKRLLTRAKYEESSTSCVHKCGDPRCGTCEIIEEGSTKILKSGQILRANDRMNCKSQNLIYCATCPTCKEFYIGQTGRLIDRVRVHKQQIRDPSIRNTPCSKHFVECGRGKFTIFPFYKMKNDDENFRRAKEDYFIELFKPSLNRK